ncbi:magnesium transporter NIPA-domain-containing protein [Melampsora americana]|nr:magnesium transporter NIPA-domain-containing protein [Melampsora americana]
MTLNNTNQSSTSTLTSSDAQPNLTHTQALASITAAISSLQSQQAILSHENDSIKTTTSPPSYKIIGIVLALVSGIFIGASYVLKKKGLLKSQEKVLEKGGQVGEGHAYLKSLLWWSGMIIMVVGEICNFVAYAFADAILVTPMGALSVVICAILSSIFLKERLSFFGKLGCLLCILGATVIALNAPQEQAVSTISEFKKLFLAPGFLVFASLIILAAVLLIFVAAPRWGKSNMFVYISVCSLIGGLSVVSTQGLGASIITSIKGDNQFKNWFMYFLIGFVVCTLLTEINYLNKALELFNTAMVTPTYYVMFTFSTLVTSIILFQGLRAPALDIVTLVLGFLVICVGITLLQMSKIDPAQISGLDKKSSMFLAVDKEPDDDRGLSVEEPGIDGLRGFAGVLGSIHRTSLMARRSRSSRQSPIRQNSGMSPRIGGSNDLEMTDNGLKRHSLWDRPIDDSIEERKSYLFIKIT